MSLLESSGRGASGRASAQGGLDAPSNHGPKELLTLTFSGFVRHFVTTTKQTQ